MQFINDFLDYHYQENRALWQQIEALDEAQFEQDAGYSIGSIKKEVLHLVWADMIWLARLKGEERPERLAEALSRAEIRAAWDEIEGRVRAFASSLSEAQLEADIEYSGILGDNMRLRSGDALLHIVNHGTAHRAEICAMFHMIGHTIPFELSYTRYRVRQP